MTALSQQSVFRSIAMTGPKPIPLQERFQRHINPVPTANGCVLWCGARTKKGYGKLGKGQGKKWRWDGAHRVSWELANGPIPKGMQVLHRCDNPPCVNPLHLFLGTNRDNNQDKINKDRHARGERHSNAKLTDAAVREIREALKDGVNQYVLAAKYSVNQFAISAINTGKQWKHVK